MAVLCRRNGPDGQDEVHPIADGMRPVVLGRDASADVVLEDGKASRRHARLARRQGAWLLEDLGSSNGTAVDGRRVERRARLRDGSVVRIGDTELLFRAEELPPPPRREIWGCRPSEVVREESGVSVCRAYQAAMDREVRLDIVAPGARMPPSLPGVVARASEAATGRLAEGLEPLVHQQVETEDPRFVVLRARPGHRLDRALPDLAGRSLADRLALVRSLVSALLSRAEHPALRVPVTPAQVTVMEDASSAPRAAVGAVELPAIVTSLTGGILHLPGYATCIAPEVIESGAEELDVGRPATVYASGCLAYRVLTGHWPTGDVSHRKALANHRALDPAPPELLAPELPPAVAELLPRLLAKEPAARPETPREILDTLESAAAETGEKAPPPPARDAAPRPQGAPAVRRAPRRRRRSLLGSPLALPLWAGLWIALFFGARWASRWLFARLP